MTIMEDHGGTIRLEDRADGGARATLQFPTGEETAAKEAQETTSSELEASSHGA